MKKNLIKKTKRKIIALCFKTVV